VQRALAKHRHELSQLMTPTRRRPELTQLDRLQADIMTQVDTFQSLLTHRLTSSTPALTLPDLHSTNDLGSLAVIREVCELLNV